MNEALQREKVKNKEIVEKRAENVRMMRGKVEESKQEQNKTRQKIKMTEEELQMAMVKMANMRQESKVNEERERPIVKPKVYNPKLNKDLPISPSVNQSGRKSAIANSLRSSLDSQKGRNNFLRASTSSFGSQRSQNPLRSSTGSLKSTSVRSPSANRFQRQQQLLKD